MNKSKQIFILLTLLSFVVISCSENKSATQSAYKGNVFSTGMPTVSDVMNSMSAEEDQSGQNLHAPKTPSTGNTSSISRDHYKGREIDVDLTKMNPMLVFGEVFSMVENPSSYIGKVIKFEGYYTSFADIYNGKYYFFVSIEDALACCAQGMEFIFDDNSREYPIDYPEDGSYVQIVGEFDVYDWQGYTFFRVITDNITVL